MTGHGLWEGGGGGAGVWREKEVASIGAGIGICQSRMSLGRFCIMFGNLCEHHL